jgi:hypothetical protein
MLPDTFFAVVLPRWCEVLPTKSAAAPSIANKCSDAHGRPSSG